jgi:signal transduction histidine kinase
MAHELRNPLTLVSGFTELLANRQDLPDQAKEMATELQRQAQQMVTLTESLLEISRLQSGRVRLSWQWANVKDIAEDEVKKAQYLTQKHTLRVEAPANPVRLYSDATRVAEALRNLIANAIKYSPAGGEIVVRVQDQAGEVVLSVSDHGIGIPKEKVSQLFQPFYRVQQAETRNIEGLGLGLALTRAIVEAHGGRIWAESEYGKGSTFSFSVPKSEIGNERTTIQAAPAGSRT